MIGLRVVHVTSIPGDIGWPTQLPTLAASRGCTGNGGASPELNSPFAHWPRRKYCVFVSPMKRSMFSFVTEFEPELSGTIGTLLCISTLCGGETSLPLESRK